MLTIRLLRKLSVRLTFFSVSLLDVGMNFSFSSSSDLLHHILGMWGITVKQASHAQISVSMGVRDHIPSDHCGCFFITDGNGSRNIKNKHSSNLYILFCAISICLEHTDADTQGEKCQTNHLLDYRWVICLGLESLVQMP